MLAGIAVAPICGSDTARHAFEVREVIQPVVTFADDGGRVVPVVVAVAVRREMDVAQRGLPRVGLLIPNKAIP